MLVRCDVHAGACRTHQQRRRAPLLSRQTGRDVQGGSSLISRIAGARDFVRDSRDPGGGFLGGFKRKEKERNLDGTRYYIGQMSTIFRDAKSNGHGSCIGARRM